MVAVYRKRLEMGRNCVKNGVLSQAGKLSGPSKMVAGSSGAVQHTVFVLYEFEFLPSAQTLE